MSCSKEQLLRHVLVEKRYLRFDMWMLAEGRSLLYLMLSTVSRSACLRKDIGRACRASPIYGSVVFKVVRSTIFTQVRPAYVRGEQGHSFRKLKQGLCARGSAIAAILVFRGMMCRRSVP